MSSKRFVINNHKNPVFSTVASQTNRDRSTLESGGKHNVQIYSMKTAHSPNVIQTSPETGLHVENPRLRNVMRSTRGPPRLGMDVCPPRISLTCRPILWILTVILTTQVYRRSTTLSTLFRVPTSRPPNRHLTPRILPHEKEQRLRCTDVEILTNRGDAATRLSVTQCLES